MSSFRSLVRVRRYRRVTICINGGVYIDILFSLSYNNHSIASYHYPCCPCIPLQPPLPLSTTTYDTRPCPTLSPQSTPSYLYLPLPLQAGDHQYHYRLLPPAIYATVTATATMPLSILLHCCFNNCYCADTCLPVCLPAAAIYCLDSLLLLPVAAPRQARAGT